LSLGVIGYAQPTLIHPFDAGAAAGWSVGGTYTQMSELLLNGSPNATWDGRLAYSRRRTPCRKCASRPPIPTRLSAIPPAER